MEEKAKEAFKVILKTLLELEAEDNKNGGVLLYPRFLLMQATSLLKQNGIKSNYWECLEVFLKFLEEEKIKIDYRTKKSMEEALRRKIIKEATAVDYRHHKILGKDY
jgi:hypothetical protein